MAGRVDGGVKMDLAKQAIRVFASDVPEGAQVFLRVYGHQGKQSEKRQGDDFRGREGVEEREITDQEIVERTLYTIVNEGAKILEESMAQRASDIDVVWVYGYGWPVYRGGPMFWADTEVLDKIVSGLKKQQARMGSDFSFSKLLLDKAEKGEKFTR